jgi:hypothetical protein
VPSSPTIDPRIIAWWHHIYSQKINK